MVEIATGFAPMPYRRFRHDPAADGCSSLSRHTELLILCARIGFNP